jgi:anti-sigma factor (TIGR02949 family)
VNGCAEYIELISAYADGELTDAEKRRLEDHLGACESCSALLDIYREISIATDEACLPAPDALRTGVMEKILSGDIARLAGNEKRRKTVYIVLSRYVPAAACLAVILLALPWVFGRGGQNYTASHAPASDSMWRGSGLSDQMIVTEDMLEASNDTMFAAGFAPAPGGGIPMPAMPAPPPPGAAVDAGGGSAFLPPPAEAAAPEPESDSDIRNRVIDPRAIVPWLSDDFEILSGVIDGSIFNLEPNHWPDIQDELWDPALDPPDLDFWIDTYINVDLEPDAQGAAFIHVTSNYYAIIWITGDLPALLMEHEQIVVDDVTQYILIPRDALQSLIDGTGGSADIIISYLYENGEYCLVIYSA